MTCPHRGATRPSLPLVVVALALVGGCRCDDGLRGGTVTTLPSRSGTDVGTLTAMVALPAPPAAVRWRTQLLSQPGLGPSDWKLLAVVDYSTETEALAMLLGLPPAPPLTFSTDEEGFFTPAIVARLKGAGFVDAARLGKPPLGGGAAAVVPGSGTVVVLLYTR